MFLLGCEQRGLLQFKDMLLNPKTRFKNMFQNISGYGNNNNNHFIFRKIKFCEYTILYIINTFFEIRIIKSFRKKEKISKKNIFFLNHYKIIITIKIKSTKDSNAVTAEQIRGSNMRQDATVSYTSVNKFNYTSGSGNLFVLFF